MDLTKFSPVILLVLSLLAVTIGHILKKIFCEKLSTKTEVLLAYTMGNSISAAVFMAVFGLSEISLFTGIVGAIFGLITALQLICNLKALEYGPLSYTTVIVSLSSLIPTLSGAILWEEQIQWAQVVGIVLMVGCLILSVDTAGEKKKMSFQWLLWCVPTFIFTGAIGVIQKWQQNTVYQEEAPAFLTIAFFVSAIFAALLLCKEKDQKNVWKECTNWLPLVTIIGGGLCAAVNNKFNLYLSGVMDSAVFFPIVNGGMLILVTLSAVVLFRERLSLKQGIGITLGIAAVIFLCNPFG